MRFASNLRAGTGFHVKAGTDHAEIVAFKNADAGGKNVEGCTMYVTLEPCSHFGRTPPCHAEVVRRKIARVVIGILDPDVRVSGRGKALLIESGIKVDVWPENSPLVSDSLKPYLYQRQTGLPYCVLKTAVSLDGAVQDAYGKSQWISCPQSRQHGHALRAESQAIIVGAETALNDKPRLNVRLESVINGSEMCRPIRVLIDSKGRVPITGDLFDPQYGPTIVFSSQNENETPSSSSHVEFVNVGQDSKGRVDLRQVLEYLAQKKGVIQCLVEGGPTLHTSFLEQRLADKVVVYRSAKILGHGAKPWLGSFKSSHVDCDSRPLLTLASVERIGVDALEIYTVIK